MFKTAKDYNEERFGGFFLLRNDGDFADVIFLYQSWDDVLIADTHYVKSADYSGYVHCCGRGCPACAKGIRVQAKLFIPLYNITESQIQFWDRSTRFENQLSTDVFKNFPNPSEYVFRITRKGAAGDVNTVYEIRAIGKNTSFSYDEILKANKTSLPEHYSTVCKEYSASELASLLSSEVEAPTESSTAPAMPSYQISPRVQVNQTVLSVETVEETALPASSDDPGSFEDPEF